MVKVSITNHKYYYFKNIGLKLFGIDILLHLLHICSLVVLERLEEENEGNERI